MAIIFKNLTNSNEFEQIVDLQGKILGIPDVEKVGLSYLKMLSREQPLTGFVLGILNDQLESSNLIGFSIFTLTSEPSSVYGVLLGILPEYHGSDVALRFFIYIKDFLLNNRFRFFHGAIDIFNRSLSNLYFHKLNFKGYLYELNQLEEKGLSNDRLLIKWILDSEETNYKLTDEYRKTKFEEHLKHAVFAKPGDTPDTGKVLVEIPTNFQALKINDPEQALSRRLQTRALFDLYINQRGYVVTAFTKNFYLLEKLE